MPGAGRGSRRWSGRGRSPSVLPEEFVALRGERRHPLADAVEAGPDREALGVAEIDAFGYHGQLERREPPVPAQVADVAAGPRGVAGDHLVEAGVTGHGEHGGLV